MSKPGALGVTHGVFFTTSLAEIKKRAEKYKVKLLDHSSVKTIFGTAPAITVFTPAGFRLDILERGDATFTLER